jgi:peptide deformylase
MHREVLIYPNPLLKEEAQEVTELTPEIRGLIEDLRDTMIGSGHSVGIAATQLGEGWRIVVANAALGKKPSINHGELVLINPEIIRYEGYARSREGCMSVPDYTGNVNRAEKIVVQYLDENFEHRVIEAEGFEAILIQHEMDHLDGVLFIDRVISRKTDLFRRK